MDTGFNINDLIQEAQYRWLKPAEVLFVLENHQKYNLTEAPPQKPASGSLFLYNKRVTRGFRKDGHSWRTKKASKSVREGHERLKVGDIEALNCYYAHGEQNANFQRRSFWMLDPAYDHIVLVHYRDITKGKHITGTADLSPDCNSGLSISVYTADNRDSISAISEPYQSYSFSPEFSSELLESNGVSQIGATSRREDLNNLAEANVNEVPRTLEEGINMNGDRLYGTSSFFEENVTLNKAPHTGTGDHVYERRANQSELGVLHHTSDHAGEDCLLSVGGSGFSNRSMVQPNPGGHTDEITEFPTLNELPEQCLDSSWNDPEVCVVNAHDQKTQEKTVLFPEREDIYANLAEQSKEWLQFLNPTGPGNTTEYMNYCHATVQNNLEPQLLEIGVHLGSDNILSPSTTSMLQEIEHSKISADFSRIGTHEDISNYYLDQINQIGVTDSTLTLAEKQRFRIQDISPEWGFATETTKVIIVGYFLCNPLDLECTWSCMFGEIEVPVQIIQEGVFCCQAPPHIPGKVTLCITSSNREACSEVREFVYRSKTNSCVTCSSIQRDVTESRVELLMLVKLVEILLHDPLVRKGGNMESLGNMMELPKDDVDCWQHLIEELLVGSQDQLSTKNWLLEELLKDKLQRWLSSKYKDGDPSGCSLTKKEQGIIHLVSGLGFEWALNPTLRCGVSVNYRDISGWTALHWAARFGREKIVAALIAAGASASAVTDPTPQDPLGKTPGSIAAEKGNKGLAGYLSEQELTSQLLSLTLEENEILTSSVEGRVENAIESILKGNVNSTDDQFSLNDSLTAVRNSAQAASRIQSFFRILSYKRRQQRDVATACCNEYGITPDELVAASKLAFHRFYNRIFDKAALSIQKKFRGWKGRQEFLLLRQKIVMIQAYVRGYRQRKKYKVIVWAVGVLDKVVLRWRHRRVGLRGFQPDSAFIDQTEHEDILKAFRKLKVNQAVEEALSRVLSMVETPEARQQYRRILESYFQAKMSDCI